MERCIGYKQARQLMQEGRKAMVIPQFRGAHRIYILDEENLPRDRVRADSWDKLRQECVLIEKTHHGRRGQHTNYIWSLKEAHDHG